ncbi:MAG: hypothetical protein QOE17_1083 [Gaiellales bacterium]|nr:hypothetical protein [Gaiellales bacterium]
MSGQTAAAAAAAAVSLACTAVVGGRVWKSRRRPGAARAALGAGSFGFGLFTIATASLWYGAWQGWGDRVFRLYYLTGGILVVAVLALGELLLVAPGRRVTRLAVATMLWVAFASTAAVLAADVDTAELARAGATPPNGAMGGPWTTILAAALNTAATVVLLAGSIASSRRRHDPRPLLVAVGVAVIALASTATRLDSYALFALGQALGIALILAGLVWRRPTAEGSSTLRS